MKKYYHTETTLRIIVMGLVAALICVITFIRIPLFGSKIQIANAVCIFAGIWMGGLYGGISSGFGAILNDILFEGNDFFQSTLTFITKFLIAFIAGKIANYKRYQGENSTINIIASIIGSLFYVILHTAKHIFLQHILLHMTWDVTWIVVGSKLPTTILNGIFAAILAPMLVKSLFPHLRDIRIQILT